MPSLLDAIEAKYGTDDRDVEAPIGIYVPRIGPRKSIPRLLILNGCGVDSAGDENSLEKTCAGILEIDLAHNRLQHWKEISKILQYTPSVSFLNLSFNILESPLSLEDSFHFPFLPRLSTLILIGSKVSWESVWFILRRAMTLSEIHLSLNDFDSVETSKQIMAPSSRSCQLSSQLSVEGGSEESSCQECFGSLSSDSGHGSGSDDEEGITFPHLKRLMFDGNPITCWEQVAKLGVHFPFLRHLGLADCPIASISQEGCQYFDNLQSISLSNTSLQDLSQISALNFLPALTELRIAGIPALSELTAHERRQLLIALLPKISRINGGAPISQQEREDAERAFIRRFSSTENPPPRFAELRGIHGELAPLLDVTLKPSTKAKVRICYGKVELERQISVYQTTNELKIALEPLLGILPMNMRLFFSNPELEGVFGREEMRFPGKQLYSYNIQDGDEIHVDLKMTLTSTPSPTTSGANKGTP